MSRLQCGSDRSAEVFEVPFKEPLSGIHSSYVTAFEYVALAFFLKQSVSVPTKYNILTTYRFEKTRHLNMRSTLLRCHIVV